MWRMAARLGTEWTAEEQYKLFLAGGILMALVVVGFGAIAILKRKVKKHEDEPPAEGFTLADLREMRERGDLTEEEFQAAKAKVIKATTAPRTSEESGGAEGRMKDDGL